MAKKPKSVKPCATRPMSKPPLPGATEYRPFPEYVIRIGLLSVNVKVVFHGIASDPKVKAVADVDPWRIVNMREDPETAKSKHDQHLDPVSVITVCARVGIQLQAKQNAKTIKPTLILGILILSRKWKPSATGDRAAAEI
jgi:hypothetical protein